MARNRHPLLEDPLSFAAHLRANLRTGEWWLVSAGVHAALFAVASLWIVERPAPPPAPTIEASWEEPVESPEREPPGVPLEVERIHVPDGSTYVPTFQDADLAEINQSDNGFEPEEVLGVGGESVAHLDGPAAGQSIGIGETSGQAFLGVGGRRNLRSCCGGKKMSDAVDQALHWLRAHQSPDGGWECAGFRRWCDGKAVSGATPEGPGRATHDVGVTGLALLAYLGAGYTHRSDDRNGFGSVVRAGLRYLRNAQDAEGCFGPRTNGHHAYDHAIAALAMVEAYGMTGSAIFRSPAQRGLDFIAIARNPASGWRYGIRSGESDTSVTAWMMMALKSASLINEADAHAGKAPSLEIDAQALAGVRTWIDAMTDDTGRAGYRTRGSGPARRPDLVDRFPAEMSESMTAAAVLARVFLGEDPATSAAVKKGAALCARRLPSWNPSDGSIDMTYWYYGSLAMFQVGGEGWTAWNGALATAVVDTQRKGKDYCGVDGSWDPIDPWGTEGGRVYATALMTMCLEVHYRYDRVFGASQPR
jgi:hypothetical protein